MPLAELAAEAPLIAAADEEMPGTARLRLVLSGAHALHAMLHPAPAPPVSELRSQVERAWELTHESRYTELADLLRGLIPELEGAARSAAGRPSARTVRAAGHRVPGLLGITGQAWRAGSSVDRRRPGHRAAERAGDPLLMAAGAYRLGFVFLGARHFDQAEETARTAAEALSHLADEGNLRRCRCGAA